MTGTSLFWGAAVIAVLLTAELTGARAGVYAGAAGGLVLSLIGAWFAGRAAAVADRPNDGNRKAWSWWGYGLLSRTVALVVLAVVYRACWDASGVVVPVLTMTGLYLTWLFWDVVRLYRQAGVSGKGHG